MSTTTKASDLSYSTSPHHRLARYGPLVLWAMLIFFASTGALSGANTSALFRPILLWLFPHASEATLTFIHSIVIRKGAHFTEYAIFGLLAARAFTTSSHTALRRGWFLAALILVSVYALSDEYHQSFVPSRTASIYDSLIDVAGGLTALVLAGLWHTRRRRTRIVVADDSLLQASAEN